MTRRSLALWIVGGALLAPTAAHAATNVELSSARSAHFPDRVYVLTLPKQRALSAGQVHVTENGQPVRGLTVTAGGAAGAKAFGAVLLIDASNSMRGEPIDNAMAAARAFASRRSPEQSLGVVYFSRDAQVALKPTTDGASIDRTLAATPTLSKGTRIYDAVSTGVKLLEDAGISAGSVVLLSDGADVGSSSTPQSVTGVAGRARVRLFTVGLRSPSFDSVSLRTLAASGHGAYAEAATAKGLPAIFNSLGSRLGNEYLVRYSSLAPLGSNVRVDAHVDGVPGTASVTYTAPVFPKPPKPIEQTSSRGWSSPRAAMAVAFGISLLLAIFLFYVLRPRKRTARSRIEGFVAQREPSVDPLVPEPALATPLLVGMDQSLEKTRWWSAFKEEVEIARVAVPAMRIALFTLAGTGLLVMLLALAGRPVVAIVACFSPAGVWLMIRARASRQRKAFEGQLGDNLQVIASALRAGHGFVGALSVVTDDAAEPSKHEFRRIVADEQLGVPLAEAIGDVARRMKSENLEYVGLVASLQRETGGNTAEVLDRVTATIRERAELRRLVSTLTAQGRFGGLIVTLLPVALIVSINVLRPHYLDPMLNRPAGVALLIGCLLFTGLGWLWIRRIVDIKV
jgi:tight adherence protein B